MPERIIEMLAHSSLCISVTSIHQMASSLSNKSAKKIFDISKDMLVSVAYNNFDMEFKSHLPTIESSGSTMKHATSAIVFQLEQATPDDLKCSDALWSTNPNNPQLAEHQKQKKVTLLSCLHIMTKAHLPKTSRDICIIACHFRHALVTLLDAFKHHQCQLSMPETINQILPTKTDYIPFRAMDINQSTSDGQTDILNALNNQQNHGDPKDNPGVADLSEFIKLIHGDLQTGELLKGAKCTQSLEVTPVHQLQYVIFVMGLFHLLMGCGNAIWHMFIELKGMREDPLGLYAQICKIQPHDYGKIESKYHFHLIHEAIHQCGWTQMLNC